MKLDKKVVLIKCLEALFKTTFIITTDCKYIDLYHRYHRNLQN